MRSIIKNSYKAVLWIAASVGLLALALVFSSPSVAEAQDQTGLCSNLAAFEQAVNSLTDVTGYATVADLQAAVAEFQASFDAVKESAAAIRSEQVDALVSAYEALQNAIGDLPEDSTIQQAVTALQPQIAAVRSTWQQLQTDLGCP